MFMDALSSPWTEQAVYGNAADRVELHMDVVAVRWFECLEARICLKANCRVLSILCRRASP